MLWVRPWAPRHRDVGAGEARFRVHLLQRQRRDAGPGAKLEEPDLAVAVVAELLQYGRDGGDVRLDHIEMVLDGAPVFAVEVIDRSGIELPIIGTELGISHRICSPESITCNVFGCSAEI